MRVYNFAAGPSTLPLPVLEQAQRELLDFQGTGMSVIEMSHRGKPFMAVNDEANALLRELMNIPIITLFFSFKAVRLNNSLPFH